MEQDFVTPHLLNSELNHDLTSADLRLVIQEGIASGPAIPAESVLAELNVRYAGETGTRSVA